MVFILENLEARKNMTMNHKKVLWVLGLFACIMVIAIGAVGYYTYNSMTYWYRAYEGPVVTMNGDKKEVNFTTIEKLQVYLPALKRDSTTMDYANIVSNNIPQYKELLQELCNVPSENSVDFISNYHIHRAVLTNEDAKINVGKTQRELISILTNNQYQIIGHEGSWSENIDENALFLESMETLEEEGMITASNRTEIEQRLRDTFKELAPYDGVMQFKRSYPATMVIGEEDRALYKLNGIVRELMNSSKLDINEQAFCMEVDRVLIWLRTEVAVAKVFKALRLQKKTKGVVVMGQTHRSQYEVLTKKLGLAGKQFTAVPKHLQGDEEN